MGNDMRLIKQDDDPLLPGSYGRRLEREVVVRAIADACADRPPSSEHPRYGVAYQNAARLHAVQKGRLVLCIHGGVTCAVCAKNDIGQVLNDCACDVRDLANDVPGMFVMYGPDSTEESAPFRSNEFLRDLTADGTRIETLAGEDVTHHIHYLH